MESYDESTLSGNVNGMLMVNMECLVHYVIMSMQHFLSVLCGRALCVSAAKRCYVCQCCRGKMLSGLMRLCEAERPCGIEAG